MWCCETNEPIIPNVIGGGCINIDKTDPENWVIEWPCPSEVISSDESVLVQSSEWDDWQTIYDLTFACCDNKVWATPNDPNPGSLQEKLFVTWPYLTNSILTWSYTIWLDINALSNDLPDELVKVNSNGDANYLSNLLTAKSPLIWNTVNDNNYRVEIDEGASAWKRPRWRMTLTNSQVLDNLVNDSNWLSQIIWFTTEGNDNWQFTNSNLWTSVKTWAYRVSFSWLIEANEWINAVRLLNISSNWSNSLKLDRKAWAGNASRWIDNTASAWTSIYDSTPLTTVNASCILEVTNGEQIQFQIRRDTNQDDNATLWKIRLVWADWSPFTNSLAWWFNVSWEYIWDIF